jgi:hypothetical protein
VSFTGSEDVKRLPMDVTNERQSGHESLLRFVGPVL